LRFISCRATLAVRPTWSGLGLGLGLEWLELEWLGLEWLGLEWLGLEWFGLGPGLEW